jgi:lon-related putative ATP-dependent protease
MHRKLVPEELYKRCDAGIFDFKNTSDIQCERGTIGQERAMRALDFGLSLDSKGFNIFILGESGTGKMTTIKALLKGQAEGEPVPRDWCYVFSFKDPDVPKAVSLEPGRAVEFKADMEELIKALRVEIPKIFESKEYERQKSAIMEEFQKKQRGLFSDLEEEAKAKGFSIRKTVSGLLIVPVTKSGEPLTEEEFDALEAKSRKKIEEMGKNLQERLDDVVRTVRGEEKQLKDKMESLEREAALSSVGHYIDELKAKFSDYEKITIYLDEVQEDILASLQDFKGAEEQHTPLPFMKPARAEPTFTRYVVNVLVNNKECRGAPCVFESNPTYYNLFGRIEHRFQYGVAETDFSMIKAGSLHMANGGYIVMDALDLLRNIFAYDAIKRSIRNRELKIEDIWEQYRLVSTTTLKPEAVPLDVKVILTGNPYLYYLLYNLDEEYKELFKVKADFDNRMYRDECTIMKYAEFIASKCEDEKMLPFDPGGVARVVEHGSRLSEHQERLSSRFTEIADLLREAYYWARKDNRDVVGREYVETAINEKIYRSNRIEERLMEMTAEGTLIVETSGEKVGQVNGLAVLSMGDYSFGKPSRITASTFAGKAGVVNIERETKMSGKIHEKAILIISNYLGGKYATKKPLTLSASITFEQLYEVIEGDSATCAELYVLLSSLSGVPVKQSISVTGSMDQKGDVQPIGGANEKIEGFFDLCRIRGLDGSHGVIIPSRNIRHLMLKKDVLDAVAEGKFNIYAIDKMEDGIEILMGMSPGEMGEDGKYPEGTVNYLVSKRLEEIAEAIKPEKKKKEEEKEEDNEEEEDGGEEQGK